jgi:hypothetical protein
MIKSIAHDAVDAVQKGKLQFVDTFVKHEALADSMEKFVVAQSQYTKQALDTGIDCFLDFTALFSKKEFAKEVVAAYGLDKFVPAATTTTKARKAK